MSDIFPKWTNKLPLQIILGAALVGTVGTLGVTYYFTPKYTRVGYQPIQPVNFPHPRHVKQLGMNSVLLPVGHGIEVSTKPGI